MAYPPPHVASASSGSTEVAMLDRRRVAGALAVLLFVAALWLYPLMTLKLGHQNDIAVHLRWVEQFYAALQDGILLPRWAYAANLGLGDPSFVYYQPLFYYITSMFLWLGAGSRYALLLAAMVPFLMLATIVYWRILRPYPVGTAVLGTMFVAGGPALYFMSTHLAAFPWSLSIPFSVLFAAESLRDRPRVHRLAVFLCLICLSHLLSGMMVLLCVGIARLIFLPRQRQAVSRHALWLGGVAIGLALASFFIFPAITQMHLINPAGWEENFNWRRCFSLPVVNQFLVGTYWFGVQWPFSALCLGLILLVLVPRVNARLNDGQHKARRLAVVALCAFALSSELAYPLYALLPPMQKLQFPYRFMFLASILGSIALVIHVREGAWVRWGRAARAAALFLVAMQVGQAVLLQVKIIRNGEPIATRAEYFSGRFGQPEYLLATRGPHWPDYVQAGGLRGDCARLNIECSNILQRSHALSATIRTPSALSLRLPVFAFPAWEATVDGKAQPVRIDRDTGVVVLDLEPGTHQVALRFGHLPAEVTGRWMTLAGLGTLLLATIATRYPNRSRARLALAGRHRQEQTSRHL